MNRRRPKAQLDLPLGSTVDPAVTREKDTLYQAVAYLRSFGVKVWRCGNNLHLCGGRQITSLAMIKRARQIRAQHPSEG